MHRPISGCSKPSIGTTQNRIICFQTTHNNHQAHCSERQSASRVSDYAQGIKHNIITAGDWMVFACSPSANILSPNKYTNPKKPPPPTHQRIQWCSWAGLGARIKLHPLGGGGGRKAYTYEYGANDNDDDDDAPQAPKRRRKLFARTTSLDHGVWTTAQNSQTHRSAFHAHYNNTNHICITVL